MLKKDPVSNLAAIRPLNEQVEREKFQYNWNKQKVYNPRFKYSNSQAAQAVVDDMRIVFSNRFKKEAKCVIDKVIRDFGSATGYKEQVWGKELES